MTVLDYISIKERERQREKIKTIKKVCVCKRYGSIVIIVTSQVQTLDKAVCILHCANGLNKSNNLSFLSQTVGKKLGETWFFSHSRTTCLDKRKLRSVVKESALHRCIILLLSIHSKSLVSCIQTSITINKSPV